MFKKIHWRQYLPFALLATLVYCVPVYYFLRDPNYTQSWLLFLGNLLYIFVIVAFLISFNKKRHENAGTITMLTAGIITTVMGIIISLVICFILMTIFIPGLFGPGPAGKILEDAPPNHITGKTNGLVFEIIADVIVGNASAGFFASMLFPFALKGDQTKEDVPPQQKEL